MLSGISSRIYQIITGEEMNSLSHITFEGDVDRRDVPAYTPTEVAAWLGIRESTLRSWIFGRFYRTRDGEKFFDPIIKPSDPNGLLSFYNLGEVHVLAATRYHHKVPFRAVRKAVDYLKQNYHDVEHPLLSREFSTDGVDLFVQTIEQTVNLTRYGQLGLKPIIDLYLEHIARDERFAPVKVYPIIRGMDADKVISITSGVSSGRPAIDGTGIPVDVIWQRHRAGEEVEVLADDFEIPIPKIQRAIDYVQSLQAA